MSPFFKNSNIFLSKKSISLEIFRKIEKILQEFLNSYEII